MATSLSIDKSLQLSAAADYHFLRKRGIALIQELCGNSWTDYNVHDPGMTLLEAICYAITDLGYRASFDIKDLMAAREAKQDNWDNIFYTASRILPCNPVTITDYRRMVVDVAGVRNAWVEKSGEYEIPMFIEQDAHGQRLSYEAEKSVDLLPLKGLYKVVVELEEDALREERGESVIRQVREKLHRHRNLCEDFVVICPVEYELFAIDMEIRVNEGADIELINAKVYNVIRELFSPAVNFYTLEQMRQKGYTVEEIFEGPLLHHGFTDPAELEATTSYKDIHLSDIVSRITDIDGVIAIERLLVPKDLPSAFSDFSQWVSHVREAQKTPRLDTGRSSVSFVRSGDRHRGIAARTADPERVKGLLRYLLVEAQKVKLKSYEREWEVPAGEYMDVADYYPFQRTLPACYKMEERYIDEHLSIAEQLRQLDKDKKAVLQLRGYLLLFEQLLADYLAQLAHLRELFSFDPAVTSTYFTQIPNDLHDYEALFIDYPAFRAQSQALLESNRGRLERRSGMLDHLLGRVGETMDAKRSIANKIAFLKDHIELSNYRGRGFDYTNAAEKWDTDAVEGVKRRVCRLLGMPGYQRKYIASGAIYIEEKRHENDIKRYMVRLVDPDERDVLLLQSVEYETRKEAEAVLNYMLEQGADRHLYAAEEKHEKAAYHLKRITEEKEAEIVASAHFQHREEMERVFERTIDVLHAFSVEENFHLVEHILLRPRISERGKHGKDIVRLLPLQDGGAGEPDAGGVGVEAPRGPAGLPDAVAPGGGGGLGIGAADYRFKMEKDKEGWRLSLVNERHEAIVITPEHFVIYKHLTRRIAHIRSVGSSSANYEITSVADGYFVFNIMDDELVLAQGKKRYKDHEMVTSEIDGLVRFFAFDLQMQAGVSWEEDIDKWAEQDPYSFQVTVVLPNWPARFRDPGFQHQLEKTIFLEMPAHVYPHVYWVDHHEMKRFEEAYKLWLEEQMSAEIPNTEILNNLLVQLNELQNQ